MMIHQNLLDFPDLKGIFKINNEKSILSRRVIWVTYWGNRNTFLSRHFLANQTSALAVDTHMIVPEEQKQSILENSLIPFSPKSDLSAILAKQKKFSGDVGEEEYMKQFWEQMALIRQKYNDIYPIVKIQKVFRGWILRKKRQALKLLSQSHQIILSNCLNAWKLMVKRQLKIQKYLIRNNKEYLLLPIKQKIMREIQLKLIQKAKEAKIKITGRKFHLKAQLRFYSFISSNFYRMKSLYNVIEIQQSKSLFINAQSFKLFQQYIIPFINKCSVNPQIQINYNHYLNLRFIFDYEHKCQQVVKIISTNFKSQAYKMKEIDNIGNIKNIYSLFKKIKTKRSPQQIHLSTKQKQKMKYVQIGLKRFATMSNNESIEVIGNVGVLKDIVRGIYFYNRGLLSNNNQNNRIVFISQRSAMKASGANKIQKVWKGYIFRKKYQLKMAKQNRAAILIQRWVRKLPNLKRSQFMNYYSWFIKNINQKHFYIKMEDYFKLISKPSNIFKFLQQFTIPYINYQTKKIILYWDHECQKTHIITNYLINKKIFYSQFIEGLLDGKKSTVQDQFNQKNFMKVNIEHLFHYQTKTSFITYKNTRYIQIECNSKLQCRSRILGILLFAFNFHQINSIIYTNNQLKLQQIQNQNNIQLYHSPFITTKNTHLYFQIGSYFKMNLKFYYPHQITSKPIKQEKDVTIIFIKNNQKKNLQTIKQPQSIQNDKFNKVNFKNYLITEVQQIYGNSDTQGVQLTNYKIQKKQKKNIQKFVKRRSLKTIKMLKDNSHQFMLDNVGSIDRLTTQPDLINESSITTLVKARKQQQKSILANIKQVYHQQKILKDQRKQQEKFTKNFINSGNFLLKECYHGYRKKIRSQIESDKIQSHDKVKEIKNNSKQKIQNYKNLQLQKIKQKHQHHKNVILKAKLQRESNEKKHYKSSIKKDSFYTKSRKVRVSFAQQCYPISSKKNYLM